MENLRLSGGTIITKEQVMKFCKENNIDAESIIDLCIEKGRKYNIRYDIAFALCLLYTNMFSSDVEGYNIAGLGLQMGYHELEVFDSYDECIETLFIVLRRFADKTFTSDCDRLVYLYIDEPNVDFMKPDGFAGTAQTIETLAPIWNSNMGGLRSVSIEEFVYLMLQSFMINKKTEIDFTNDRDVSFYVRLESKGDLKQACQLKRKIQNLRFIKGKIPVTVISSVEAGMPGKKSFYVVDIGDFKYRGFAEGCQNNLKMFGYYGKVGYRPSKRMIEKLEAKRVKKEENS